MGRKLLLLIALVYTLLLVISSLFSLEDIPVQKITTSDKILHGTAYFLLVIVWSFIFIKLKRKSFTKSLLITCSGAFLFGIVIEILQGALTTYREPDVFDAIANTIGILIAMFVIAIKRMYLVKK